MKRKRQSAVEPVFGALTQFMGLRKINTIGIEQANKVKHLSAIAYKPKPQITKLFLRKESREESSSLAPKVSDKGLFFF
jgi:hypothetical protein